MSRPNFRIVENDRDYSEIYDDFKKDYLSREVTVAHMLEKYDISANKYRQIKKEVAEETGVNIKPTMHSVATKWKYETRYIDKLKNTGKYRVSKFINGFHKHFGVYDDLKTAIYVRDKLEENDWSEEFYETLKWEIHGSEKVVKKDLEEVYDKFKTDFMKGHTIKYLRTKYDLTEYGYITLSRLVRSEMGLVRKPQMSAKEVRLYE